MEQLRQTLHAFLAFCMQVLALIFDWLGVLETWLRGELTRLGVQGSLQSAVILVVAVLFLLAAFRLAAGLIRVVLVVFLLLLVVHLALPYLHP